MKPYREKRDIFLAESWGWKLRAETVLNSNLQKCVELLEQEL